MVMIRAESLKEKIIRALHYLFLTLIALVTIYPFWTQVVLSFESGAAVYNSGLLLYPQNFSLEGYKLAFKYDMLWSGYANTILRVLTGVMLSLTFTSLTAFPLSKTALPFNRTFTGFILFTMLFGGGLIPSYLLVKNLGLYDSIWALVIPGSISAFNVLIMRNFFRSIPDSLEESARVDGAGYWRIFATIIVPLSLPVIATVALWVGVMHWNAWFDSMIYISDSNKQVLQIVIRRILTDNNVSDLKAAMVKMENKTTFSGRELQATMIMLSILPMLVVYPFIQRFFVKGIMLGAIKG